MALKRYILTQDYKAPFIRITGNPKKPQKICGAPFKKGDVVVGELKHANDKPAFVLVMKGEIQLPFPLTVIREVAEKEIVSNGTSSAEGPNVEEKSSTVASIISTNPKVQYLDACIVGGLLGFVAVWFSEKKGWLVSVDKKNKIIGVVVGALAGAYLVYRIKNSKKPKAKE